MKNIKIFTTVLLLLNFFSCNSFLAEDPRAILSPENYFKTEDEIKAGVNGLYTSFYNGVYYGEYGIDRFYTYCADEIEPSRAGTGGLAQLCNYIIDEDHEALQATWKCFYQQIYNANMLMSSFADNENIREEAKNQFMGEALFLRSLAYYHLTNIYGNVPYYRDALSLEEIQTLGRFDKNVIRTEILKDLQKAQDFLVGSYTGNDLGRASKWAAATLMVKIYLIQQNWKAARDKAVEIITNSPHRLLDNFADLFAKTDGFNDESILQAVFTKDINPGTKINHFTPRIQDEPKSAKDRSALTAALAARNEGFNGGGLAIPMGDLVDKFPLDDLRRPMTVVTNYLGYNLKFPYMPKKWNLDVINSPKSNHGDDYVIFRLADVYLMAAEAENELNGPANAYQYINKVRERAFEPDKPLSGLTQQQFRQAIYDERRWELAGEGHRKMDLIRWGILVDVVRNLKDNTYTPEANIQPHHIMWPVPGDELRMNPALLESDPTNNGYR